MIQLRKPPQARVPPTSEELVPYVTLLQHAILLIQAVDKGTDTAYSAESVAIAALDRLASRILGGEL